ncbi:MAG: hypothetical protein WC626_12250 [Methanoregula sp.]
MITTIVLTVALLFFASPVAAMDISITGSNQGWAFNPGSTNQNQNPMVLNVTSDTASWHVNVVELASANGKNPSYAGRLMEYNSQSGWVNGGSVISNNMTVVGESITNVVDGNTATLGPTETLIENGHAQASKQLMTITLQQPITLTDLRLTNGNMYQVVITFIGYES